MNFQEHRTLWEHNCMNIQMTSNSAGVFQEENIYMGNMMYSDRKLKVSNMVFYTKSAESQT